MRFISRCGLLVFTIQMCGTFTPIVAAAPPADDGVVPVTMNGLEIGIDAVTGGMRKLACAATGAMLETSREDASLLDVAYPIEEFVPLRLGTRFSKVHMEKTADAVTLNWEPLGPSRTNFKLPDGQVTARVTIRPADDRRSVIMQCTIDNRTAMPVPQVLFPDLRGIRPFAGPAATQLRLPAGYPVYPFTEDPIPPHTAQYYVNSGWKEYTPSVGTYGALLFRWLDIGGYKGGLSVFQKAWATGERPTIRTYRQQADPSNLRLMWEYKAGIEPGKSWTSDEVWLTPHAGGWAKGIEVYRAYAQSMHPQRELPAAIRDGLGVRTIFMMQSPENDPAYADFRFTDIPKVAAEAKAHGLVEVCLWGWCDYFTLPYKPRPELGTQEEFLAAIRQSHEIGVNVCPFVSNVLVRNSFAERYSGSPGAPAWVYHPDLVPMMDPYYLAAGRPVRFWDIFSADPRNKNYQEDVIAAFKEWIERGVYCWSWDQFFADSIHSDPPGLTALLARLRTMCREKDPQATFSGEEVTSLEFDAGVMDYTWNWADYVDAGPTTNVFRTPRLNCNIEDSPRIVKAGFMDNLLLNVMPRKPDHANATAMIHEKPALSAALKEVVALRKQFLSYFVEGTFIGDSVLSEANACMVRGYQHGKKLLIIVLNNQADAREVTLKSALDLWLPAAQRYEVKAYDTHGKPLGSSTVDSPDWTGKTPKLEPLDLAFFEIATAP